VRQLRRAMGGLLVGFGLIAACAPGPDGPAFVYRLVVRNDTDALRLVVPVSTPNALPDSTAYVVVPGDEIWTATDSVSGDLERGRALVFDGSCRLVGDATITPPDAQMADVVPTYLLVIDDPTSIVAALVEPTGDTHVAPSSDLQRSVRRGPRDIRRR
jgi:hypothetical protein